MMKSELDITNIKTDRNSWGVSFCPLCKGLGYIGRDIHPGCILSPSESICAICELHKAPDACEAWSLSFDLSGNPFWSFSEENACDEIKRILCILDSLSTRMKRISVTERSKSKP